MKLGNSSPWLARIVMVGVGLFLALAMMEVAARALHLGSGGFWEPHPLYGWRNIPGADGWESCYGECAVHVQINSLGLRDAETSYQKPVGARRILLLGDSTSAGLQVPLQDTFAQRLERRLSEGGERWEVINAAVNGFGTDNALLYFQEEGYKFDPDIVILGVYLANDVYNNHYQLELRYSGSGHKPFYTLTEEGALVLHNFPVEDTDSLPVMVGSFLKRNFQLPRFLAQVLRLRNEVPEVVKPVVRLLSGERGAEADKVAQRPSSRGDICDQQYAPEVAEAWQITKALLLELKQQVEAGGARFIVLVIPAAPQIDPPREGRDWYCDRANEELAGFLEEAGIESLDLLTAFRQHSLSGGPPLYYQRDFHMNVEGHALTAGLLADALLAGLAGDG